MTRWGRTQKIKMPPFGGAGTIPISRRVVNKSAGMRAYPIRAGKGTEPLQI